MWETRERCCVFHNYYLLSTMGPGDQTRSSDLCSKHFYPQNHLAGFPLYFLRQSQLTRSSRYQLGWPASELSRFTCLYVSAQELEHNWLCLAFMWVLEPGTQVLLLSEQVFLYTEIFSNLETWTWMRKFTDTVTKSPLIPCPVGQTISLRRLGKQWEEQRLLIIPKRQSASISYVSNQLKTGTNHLRHNLAIKKNHPMKTWNWLALGGAGGALSELKFFYHSENTEMEVNTSAQWQNLEIVYITEQNSLFLFIYKSF